MDISLECTRILADAAMYSLIHI